MYKDHKPSQDSITGLFIPYWTILRHTHTHVQTNITSTHSDFLATAKDRQRVVGVIGTKERQLWKLPQFSGSLSTGEIVDPSAGTSCMSPGSIVCAGDGWTTGAASTCTGAAACSGLDPALVLI